MKINIKITLPIFCLISMNLNAQLGGQAAFTALVGVERNGFVGDFSYDKFLYDDFISFGLQTNVELFKDKKKRDYIADYKSNAQIYLATLKYYKLLFHSTFPEIKLYAGGGIMVGYNSIDKLKEVEIIEKSSMVYGGTVNFQTDIYLASFSRGGFLSDLALIGDASFNYLFKREQGNQVFNLLVGLRFTMN